MFWFIGLEAHGILAPPPGIELTPPVLEDEVLTTGSPGKSPSEGFNCWIIHVFCGSHFAILMLCS